MDTESALDWGKVHLVVEDSQSYTSDYDSPKDRLHKHCLAIVLCR